METKVKKKLPLYKLKINPDKNLEGISAISIVTSPAIETGFIAMSDQKELKFQISDPDKQELLGPVLVPGKPIFRKDYQINEDGSTEDAEVYFDADDVEMIVQKFFMQNNQSNVNLEHSLFIDGAVLYQSFISDKANGINPKQFSELPDKTFFVKYKITDPDLWTSIKQGIFTGFSLEGFFDSLLIKQSLEKSEEELANELYSLLTELEKIVLL